MDVRDEMNYTEYELDALQASARRYVELYADPLRVGVNVRSKLGPGEPFYIFCAKNSWFVFTNVARYLSRSQLNRLEDGCGTIYGRTESGPFCELEVFKYLILSIKRIPDQDQEEIRKLVYEE